MNENEEEAGRFAVPGEESHEHPDVLGPDERGDEEEPPPPAEPKQPAPG